MIRSLPPGTVILVDFGDTRGREQSGVRPAVVVSSSDFEEVVERMLVVVPCTRTDRGWRNHVDLRGETGLKHRTFAMTEQPRTIDQSQVLRVVGRVEGPTLDIIASWVHTWLHAAA